MVRSKSEEFRQQIVSMLFGQVEPVDTEDLRDTFWRRGFETPTHGRLYYHLSKMADDGTLSYRLIERGWYKRCQWKLRE